MNAKDSEKLLRNLASWRDWLDMVERDDDGLYGGMTEGEWRDMIDPDEGDK